MILLGLIHIIVVGKIVEALLFIVCELLIFEKTIPINNIIKPMNIRVNNLFEIQNFEFFFIAIQP